MLRRRNFKHYSAHKEAARVWVKERLAHHNAHYQLPLRKVFIKNTKSRWASCSSRGNLNFNYKVIFLPHDIADYIVVHELCHLLEFNHSPKFWARVAERAPNHRALRQRLRAIERGAVIQSSAYASHYPAQTYTSRGVAPYQRGAR